MTDQTEHPFDLLRNLVPPEPDPVRMQAAITAAQTRFAGSGLARKSPVGGGLSAALTGWRRWFVPLGAGVAAASVIAVWILTDDPGLMPGGPGSRIADAPGDGDMIAPKAPPGPVIAGGPESETQGEEDAQLALRPGEEEDGLSGLGDPFPSGPVLGARPAPGGQVPYPGLAAAPERHVFGGFEILSREASGRVTLSLIRDGAELAFDTRMIDPGLDFALLDAFVLNRPGAPDLLLLQSRIADAVNWDAFVMEAGRMTLSGEISRRIHDAPDRAAVVERLSP